MSTDKSERAGALVARAWLEPGRDEANLRARITFSADLPAKENETVRVASDRAGILGAVSEWLDRLTG